MFELDEIFIPGSLEYHRCLSLPILGRMNVPRITSFLPVVGLVVLCYGCVDPVEPGIAFREPFVLVEGEITDQAGRSEVSISVANEVAGALTFFPIDDAQLTVFDDLGNSWTWFQVSAGEAVYRVEESFAAVAGRTYFLRVVTPDGRTIESEPAALVSPVGLEGARLVFEQEAFFSDDRNRFIPAFRMLVSLDDPPEEENYYRWRFRYWEMTDICASCERQVYRNGQCIDSPLNRFTTYDYRCSEPCWIITDGGDVAVFSDAFSQGQQQNNVEAGTIEFRRRGGLLVALEQFNLSEDAFEYFNQVRLLAQSSGGLNAPLPTPLIGNLRDVEDEGRPVLGYVSVAPLRERRIYVNRDTVQGAPLPSVQENRLEPLMPAPPTAPCLGANRTNQRPVGWPQ